MMQNRLENREPQQAVEKGPVNQRLGSSSQPRTAAAIEAWLISHLSGELGIEPDDIDVNEPLDSYGLSSRGLVTLSGDLEDWLEIHLSPTIAYQYSTVADLASHLAGLPVSSAPISSESKLADKAEPIAIIGMGCRFPGAPSLQAFWQLLRNGVDAISQVPPERWDAQAFYDPDSTVPGKMNTCWGGFLAEGVDQFDPHFFGISPREAAHIDPQQRLLVEVAWEALENAGLAPEKLAGTQTGVFIGISTHDYSQLVLSDIALLEVYASTGNAGSIAANRLSYLLDLRGPSLAIDTACSSSLVALHMACQSLGSGESQLALVGGVNVILSPEWTIPFSQAGLLAPDGRCKTFDARADGYVRGEGCGVVVLKRLSKALQDGDSILALIRGSAVNQDGRSNGLLSPNGLAQEAVIRQALESAGVAPTQISYVEAHGTGTILGDPIEFNALKAVLSPGRGPGQCCGLGSVKTNIGHLEAAAGIAGLIKMVLALQHKEIPPHLHFQTLNPHISLEGTSFYIPTTCQAWPDQAERRLCGISSFGFGGTNAHVTLEEATFAQESGESRPWRLLTFSAKTEQALERMTFDLVDYLREHPSQNLADVAYTFQTGRKALGQRRMLICRDLEDARIALEARDPKRVLTGAAASRERPVTFMFPGLGDHHIRMAETIYQTEPTFRECVDRCADFLKPQLGLDLRQVIYPPQPQSQKTDAAPPAEGLDLRRMLGRDTAQADEATQRLNQTLLVHPALFVIEYAMAQLWIKWGIQPRAMIGYSIGEYVAACLAGVFSLKDALLLVAQRSQMMHALPGGAMLAVPLSEEAVQPWLGKGLSLSAVNGASRCVVAGPSEAVVELERYLSNQGLACRRLQAAHAFHSRMMEPIRANFTEVVKTVQLRPPQIPYVSNVTGNWITAAEATEPNYWSDHLCQPVRFGESLRTLSREPEQVLLEVGPGQTLCSLAWQQAENEGYAHWTILPSMRHVYDRQPEWPLLLGTLGKLWLAGLPVDWSAFYASEKRRRISLPTYPFERERYWIKDKLARANTSRGIQMPALQRATGKTAQYEQILSQMLVIVASLLQTEPRRIRVDTPFLEMGADSLVLVQAIRTIENTFGIEVTVRQIFEELTTLEVLAAYIDQRLALGGEARETFAGLSAPARPALTPTLASAKAISLEALSGTGATSEMGRLMTHQLEVMAQMTQVMAQQLQALGQGGSPLSTVHSPQQADQGQSAAEASPASKPFVPYQPFRLETEAGSKSGLTLQQQQYLAAFIERYTRRTSKSKQLTQRHRPVLADNRASAGFRFSIKEMLYPIIGERSEGSRLWDVDGNEYIDLTMGFGVNLFGHKAPFIQQAIEAQLQQGIQLGPQSNLAGQVAELLCELTGMERATFCNSGTEAVMMALRLARTVTGRKKIALFSGSFHGEGDATLVIADVVKGQRVSSPMAPGVIPGVAEDVLILNYGEDESLEILRTRAHELAAVLVEPVQSRRPDWRPQAFLQKLRRLTQEAGIALIFDEMVTGFRVHPGGAQAWFGIQADVATFGKIVGGGMPIGIVAGKARYMDSIDGGMWDYGDTSYPRATTTFFAGTFCKHPLSMAAAQAVLKYLKEQGPTLQDQLNQRTSQLVEKLNQYFEKDQVPIRVVHFSSLFRFTFTQNMDLLFYHLLEKGVYIWEGRNMFLSTAHTDKDIEYFLQAVKDSVAEMRAGGFLPQASSSEHSQLLDQALQRMPVSSEWASMTPAPQTWEKKAMSLEGAQTLPLTAMQQEIWLQCQMGIEASIAYHNPVILRVRGELYLQALRKAFQNIIERHQALRTVFSPDGSSQQILPALTGDIPFLDFSDLSEHVQATRVEAWLVENSRQIFDLTCGPLIRAQVLKLAAQEHLLVLTTHQIIADGLSIGLLLRELGVFYSAECHGIVPQIAPPALFREYVTWHTRHLQSQKMAMAEAYWLKQFAGDIPVLDLPTDYARRPIETYAASRYSFKIEAPLCAQLKRLATQHRCTLFMTLLACFKVLLYRLTGQTDIVVGIPTAGRPDTGEQHLIGGCINLVPVRSRLTGSMAFSDYLASLASNLVDVYEYSDYPFGLLVRKLNPPRDPSRWPLVSVFFNLDRPLETPSFLGLSSEFVPHPISYANYDLNVNILQAQDELEIDCDYNLDLFATGTIERWIGHFRKLLAEIVADPHQRLADLSLLTALEQHQVLVEWNDTRAPFSREACIHQLFERRTAQSPDAVAVVWPAADSGSEEALTYGELDRRANQLAHYLQKQGGGPEVPVALCVARCVEMVIGVLGILKAGAAYIPLDPTYPENRLAMMLEEARVPLLLTQSYLVPSLPKHQAQVTCLDVDWEAIAQESGLSPRSAVSAENLAYIIYTSGSTGRPKGVMIQHRSLVNAYSAWETVYQLGSTVQCHLQMASFSFDVFAGDLVRALCSGGKLVLCPHDVLLSPSELHALIQRERIDCAEFVPAVLRGLVQHLEADRRRLDLPVLICGSDSWYVGEYKKFRQFLTSETRLINSFGLTEATIDSACFEDPHLDLPPDRSVPIGRPLSNTQIYLLNPALQPVPIGVLGELYVGGEGVARGYIQRPDLTAERFVPYPFGKPGARLYRTGDLARYLPDGNIEFLGRQDTQVKIRGFRVELGEIDAVLAEHPLVQECATLVCEAVGRPDSNHLVAYVACLDGQISGDELRHFLKSKLPDYMVPTTFMFLEALPLTPNGKVDRNFLPDPDHQQLDSQETFVAPRTPIEETVAKIWAQVLGAEGIGIHDNFFQVGGHSLLVTQIVSRIRTAFEFELPLRSLFESPTIARLAELIETAQWAKQCSHLAGRPTDDREEETV